MRSVIASGVGNGVSALNRRNKQRRSKNDCSSMLRLLCFAGLGFAWLCPASLGPNKYSKFAKCRKRDETNENGEPSERIQRRVLPARRWGPSQS
jgi:hypothetical protein